jgi:hypothetical protein
VHVKVDRLAVADKMGIARQSVKRDHSPPCISSQWTSRFRRSEAAPMDQLAAAEMDQS